MGKFYSYSVGQIVPEWRDQEGVFVSMAGDALSFTFLLFTPTKREMAEFTSGNQIKFAIYDAGEIAFFLLKIGRLNWSEAPFSVWREKNRPDPNNLGNHCTLILVDSTVGKIEHIRTAGLTDATMDEVKLLVKKQLGSPSLTKYEYLTRVAEAMNYTTEQMVARSVVHTAIEQQHPN